MVLVASQAGGLGAGDASQYACGGRSMTPEVLLEICKERNMWALPRLNTQLYLNYKGFERMGGLQGYVAVRTLHLGNNNIAEIEGLDCMPNLRSLHLECNRIAAIEHLHKNLELRQLNLESNCIKSAHGVSHLVKLEQLNLAHNLIARIEDLEDLRPLEKLSNIDVSHNQLDATEGVVEFWAAQPAIRLLRYHGNPGVRSIEHYRKRLINSLPQLSYLDERPVFPVERRGCEAWAEGGLAAMHQAKRDFARERSQMVMVDPERREILTNMRKAAIARIEREEREREEQEAEKRRAGSLESSEAASCGKLQDGEEGALADYARRWQTKLSLHGPEGLRAQLAKEDGAASAGGASAGFHFQPSSRLAVGRPDEPSQAADAPAATGTPEAAPLEAIPQLAPRFAPPSRAAPPAGAAAAPREASTPSEAKSAAAAGSTAHPARHAPARPAGASDFRVSSEPGAGDAEEGLQVRQLAVLGEDPWRSAGATAAARGGGAAEPDQGRAATAPEVLPLIWERNLEQNRARERECLEQSMAAAGAAWAKPDALGTLD